MGGRREAVTPGTSPVRKTPRRRFERPTSSSGGKRSNPLSYRGNHNQGQCSTGGEPCQGSRRLSGPCRSPEQPAQECHPARRREPFVRRAPVAEEQVGVAGGAEAQGVDLRRRDACLAQPVDHGRHQVEPAPGTRRRRRARRGVTIGGGKAAYFSDIVASLLVTPTARMPPRKLAGGAPLRRSRLYEGPRTTYHAG
jgi:hypothetical protein